MSIKLPEAKSIFQNFILKHSLETIDYYQVPLEHTGLLEEFPSELEWTHFNDPYDTLIYSRLIGRAIEMNDEIKRIIDLGAGSSIPTLLALRNSQQDGIVTLAVDIDAEAMAVGERNAARLGLAERYQFLHLPLQELVQGPLIKEEGNLIVSNPPYIATSEEISERHYIPINGGPAGDRYLLDILSQDYPSGTPLALLWGTLTDPTQVMKLIHECFDMLHTETYRIHFGHYTSQGPMKDYLYRLREEGRVFFENDESQYVIGMILKAR